MEPGPIAASAGGLNTNVVPSASKKGSRFVELLSETPTVEELEAFGVFISNEHLVAAYRASTSAKPEELRPPVIIASTPLPPEDFKSHLSSSVDERVARPARPSRGLRPMSTSDLPPRSTSPLAAASSFFLRVRPTEEYSRSHSDYGVDRPLIRVDPGGSSDQPVGIQDLQARKLRKPRPTPKVVAPPVFTATLSSEPDPMSPASSLRRSLPAFPKRHSWRRSTSSTPTSPASEASFLQFPAREASPSPPKVSANLAGSPSSSDDSYNGDVDRDNFASKAFKGRLSWAGRKARRRTSSSMSGSSWEVVALEQPDVTSFEVLYRRPSLERSHSAKMASDDHKLSDGLGLQASLSTPNLGNIEEGPEPSSIRHAIPMEPFPDPSTSELPSSAASEGWGLERGPATVTPKPSRSNVVASQQSLQFHSSSASSLASLSGATTPAGRPEPTLSTPVALLKRRGNVFAEGAASSDDEEDDERQTSSSAVASDRADSSSSVFDWPNPTPLVVPSGRRPLTGRRSASLTDWSAHASEDSTTSGGEDTPASSTAEHEEGEAAGPGELTKTEEDIFLRAGEGSSESGHSGYLH